ncbi:MAG TPA: sulfur carrier protein ThiS [Candidatus Acidoferrales bacterium]|nr:sulfur carrier protein ThiS [Candidatus Acidoferrales bacterium]
MTLYLNGEQREFPDGLTVAALVAQIGIKSDRAAVELNLEIVPRARWDTTTLKDGDKVEVVHFVGGGTPTRSELAQQEPLLPQEAADAVWHCPTCAAQVSGNFCPDCGEKKRGIADLSIQHFFTHALGELFHFDSKIFRSFRLLFAKPGFLTAEYLRGCRKPYLHPFQLFFVTNLIYFFLQPYLGWSGLRTTLDIQLHMMSYSSVAARLAAARIAAKGISFAQFAPLFDHVVDVQARSLVLVMVLIYAVLLAAMQWRRKEFFGQHLVFSLHFTAFWLMAIFVVLYPGISLFLRFALRYGVHLPSVNWDKLIFPVALLLLLTYSFLALRTVYRESFFLSFVKALVFAISFHYVLDIYRFILFLTALYCS